MNKNNTIFRKKSIDRINSPEQLNEYIRVTNLTVWFALIGIIIFLLGVILWGIFGHIETTVDTVSVVQNGQATCYIHAEDVDSVEVGAIVNIKNTQSTVETILSSPIQMNNNVDNYILFLGEYEKDDFCYTATIKTTLPNGIYSGSIVTESLHPIRFIIN